MFVTHNVYFFKNVVWPFSFSKGTRRKTAPINAVTSYACSCNIMYTYSAANDTIIARCVYVQAISYTLY